MSTPGLRFIGSHSPKLATPFLVTYLIRHALDSLWQFAVSNRLCFFATLACFPLAVIVHIVWNDFSERREASALGAIHAPEWNGKWPGNVDLVLWVLRKFSVGYPGEGFEDVMARYGTIVQLKMLWQGLLVTTEPEHIKTLLTSEFKNFEKGSEFRVLAKSILGTGVFNSDGDMWKFHRSMTRPFFSKDRISHFELFGRHADVTIASMKSRFREGYAVDFQDVISRFTLDAATEFLFGTCVNSSHASLPYPHNAPRQLSRGPHDTEGFSIAFSDALFVLAKRSRMPLWQLWEVFGDNSKKPMAIVHAYIDPIMKSALDKKKKGLLRSAVDSGDAGEGSTLVDHLVSLTDDPVICRDEVLNIMLAGRDTTASTLTSAIYLLSMHPDVLARLRKEILDTVGPTRRPTYEDIKEMKYLRAFINETLRLYPPIPFNMRNSINATTLSPITPGGKPIYIPAKACVTYSVWLMHRRKDLWGPDAEEFDPDRFLDDRLHKYITPRPFIFLPFNAGPRICPGQQFAYNEISFMLTVLLQQFAEMTLDANAQPPEGKPPAYWANEPGRQSIERLNWKSHLVLYANGGVWVRMREVTDTSESTK